MNKKKIDKVQQDITKTLDTITTKVTEIADKILEQLKKHKKLIAISIAAYVAYKFLFSDGSDNEESE